MGGGGGAVTVVWRVVVVVVSGVLEQETSIKAKTESAELSMIALFIALIVSSKDDSLEVASPDVFRTKNYFKSRLSLAVFLVRRACASIPGSSS